MEINPALVKWQSDTGNGNMGTTSDVGSPARFYLDAEVWFPITIRVNFTGGTGDATFSIQYDDPSGNSDYDFTLRTIADVGTDATSKNIIDIRIPRCEHEHWTFTRGGVLVLNWTNPDSGTMRWAAKVGLYAA